MSVGTTPGLDVPRGKAPKPGGSLWQRIVKYRWCYLFIVPNLVLAIGLTLYPTVASWWYSLLDWDGFSWGAEFIGLDNYSELGSDSQFWAAFRRSFWFMLVAVPLQLAVSLLLALVLNDKMLKLSPVFRTMFFLPVVTSAAIVGIVMSFVFSPFNGPLNMMLVDWLGVDQPIDFLGDGDVAMWTVIGVYVWKHVGLTMVYWLAALQVIPAEMYEAARMDGARRWQQFRSITLPLILPFALIILLISVVPALNVFALVDTMTGGGPFFATEVMEVFIYRTAFGTEEVAVSTRLGYASAAGVLFGLTVMAIAILQGVGMRWWQRMRQSLQTTAGGGADE